MSNVTDFYKGKEVFEEILRIFLASDLNDRPNKKGGWLIVREQETGENKIDQEFGELSEYMRGLCRQTAKEKIDRLAIFVDKHISSYQSRDPENKQWGGAIAAIDYLIGFSGLSEVGDEALVTVFAVSMNFITLEHALSIAQESKNPITYKLLQTCGLVKA